MNGQASMFRSFKKNATVLKPGNTTSSEPGQTSMAQSRTSLPLSPIVNRPDGITQDEPLCLEPPSTQSSLSGRLEIERERSLEELEELLRRVREEQRRLSCSYLLPSSSETEEPVSKTGSETERGLVEPQMTPPRVEIPVTLIDNPLVELSEPAADDCTWVTGHSPVTAMGIEDHLRASNLYYGTVNPSILRGFGGDDESIWLVDDEETDSQGILTPLSSSVDDLQTTLRCDSNIGPEAEADGETECDPHEQLLRPNDNSQSAPASGFQYRQIPELLDGHEWREDAEGTRDDLPPAYESLDSSSLPEPVLPGYSQQVENPSIDQVSSGNPLLVDLPQNAMSGQVISNSTDPWRYWGPQQHAREANEHPTGSNQEASWTAFTTPRGTGQTEVEVTGLDRLDAR